MNRYIDIESREATHLISNLEPRWKPMAEFNGDDMKELNSIAEAFLSLPIADVVEVRHGGWIVTDADDGMCDDYAGFIEFHCSECGLSVGIESGEYDWYYGDPIPWKYCPMCGAKMDGEKALKERSENET